MSTARRGSKSHRTSDADWSSASSHERRKRLATAFVERSSTAAIVQRIDQVRAWGLAGAEPTCILVEGNQGTGKSTFLKRYAEAHPQRQSGGCRVTPVLYVGFQSDTTPIGVAKTMLYHLMGQSHTSGTKADLTFRVKEQLRKQKVEVVLGDDFQHMAERGKHASVSKAADWIKEAVKDTNIPFVITGTDPVTRLIQENKQLDGITPYRYELGPFRYETQGEKLAFRRFLSALDRELPFDRDSMLGSDELALSLFLSTSGNLRRLCQLIRGAATEAISRDAPCISIDDLAAGFEELASSDRIIENPFRHGVFSLSQSGRA